MSKKKKFFQQRQRALTGAPPKLMRKHSSLAADELLEQAVSLLVPQWLDAPTNSLTLPEPVDAYSVGSWNLRLGSYEHSVWPWSLTIWNSARSPSLDSPSAVKLQYGLDHNYCLWSNGDQEQSGTSDWTRTVAAVRSAAQSLENGRALKTK